MPSLNDESLRNCQSVIKYAFADISFLRRALVHASASVTRIDSNERLEFLGDAIFGAIVCEELFHRYPKRTEGELTRIKSAVVSRSACARVTNRLGLGEFVVLGKGVASRSGKIPSSILAAVMESVIAAIYLDGGLAPTREFVIASFDEEFEAAAGCEVGENFKSQLQQRAQRAFGETPTYDVVDEKGPDHSKSFKVAATLGDKAFEPAWGPSKKEAEQRAANNALSELDGQTPPHAEIAGSAEG